MGESPRLAALTAHAVGKSLHLLAEKAEYMAATGELARLPLPLDQLRHTQRCCTPAHLKNIVLVNTPSRKARYQQAPSSRQRSALHSRRPIQTNFPAIHTPQFTLQATKQSLRSSACKLRRLKVACKQERHTFGHVSLAPERIFNTGSRPGASDGDWSLYECPAAKPYTVQPAARGGACGGVLPTPAACSSCHFPQVSCSPDLLCLRPLIPGGSLLTSSPISASTADALSTHINCSPELQKQQQCWSAADTATKGSLSHSTPPIFCTAGTEGGI